MVFMVDREKKKRPRFRKTLTARAEDEIRTRDPQLGKLMLYQLSYFRLCFLVVQR